MKILAIRGENLASLHQPFEMDLEQGPLAGVGLFSITGPTGAGKSTLLDALCLALYDTTPRLDMRMKSPPLIGSEEEDEKDKLRASDPRTLLRRGATSAWAEVDFLGVDQRAYTARWSVRRSRDRIDGRIQPQELSLHSRGEEAPLVSGKKTEVKQAIEERVGLDFDQFRRSVLLAQGDFAAFLKADGEERAKLLERMTGTEIYCKLSQLAHQRERQEQEVRCRLEDRHGALEILAPEASAKLEEERDQVRSSRSKLVEEQARLTQGLEWLNRGVSLETAVFEARSKLEEAEALWLELEPQRQELSRRERAEVLRPLAQALTLARSKHEEAQAELIERETAAARSLEELEAQQELRRKAEDLWETSLSQERLSEGEVEKARKLDNLVESSAQREAQLDQDCQRAEGHLEVARQARLQVEKRLEEQRLSRTVCQEWLQQNQKLEPLVASWSTISRDLERCGELLPGLQAEEAEAERLLTLEEESQQASTEAQKNLDSVDERVRKLRNETQQVSDQVVALAPAGDIDPMDLLAGVRRGLETLTELLETRTKLSRELEEVREKRTAGAKELEEVTQQGLESRQEAELMVPRLEEARRALDLFRQAQDLEERRQQLVPEEPCPLCGSREHPWVEGEGLPTSQQDRVRELEADQARAETAAKQADRQAESLRGKLDGLSQRIQEGEDRLRDLGENWRVSTHRAEAGLSADPEAPDQAKFLGKRLAQVREQEETLGRLRKQLQGVQDLLQQARDQREEAQRRAIECEKALDAARLARESHHREGEARRREDQRLRKDLAVHFTTKQLDLPPLELHAHSLQQVEEFRSRQAKFEELERTIQPLEGELGSLRTQEDQRLHEAQGARSELAASREDLERRRQARREILDGESVEAFKARLRRGVEESLEAKEVARKNATAAQQAREVAVVRMEEALRRRENSIQVLEEARRELTIGLEREGLPEESLEPLLSQEKQALLDLRQQVDATDKARDRAREQLELRTNDLQKHTHSEVPEAALEAGGPELEVRLEEVAAGLQERDQELGRLQEKLNKDQQSRAKGQALLEELATQLERCRLWGSMRDLIGAADGKKFRTFAQSLTLDCLLEQANSHLRELAPRYRLQRIPGAAMDLQVIDCDLADELRSVHSLSGGEGFLVSLALALGLSSLTAAHTQVESLFVDEGFGSLDSTSLDRALDALQALQATGRQVGVISHVSGLADQIGVQVQVLRQGTGRSRVQVG